MNKFRYHIIFLFAILQWHCIQTYISPYQSPTTGYLVVEGYITGNGPTTFKLSRTIPLPGDSTIPVVTGAHLQIEASDNSLYPFTETGNGFYLLPSITMNTAARYRLRITNVNNETYLSDYVPFKPTPPIDSINWINIDTGVVIYANTHDPTGNTRYYQWKYNETWEYTGSEQSGYIWQGDSLAPRPLSAQIYICYHTDSSGNILIATSDKLAQDVIYEHPLVSIGANTQPLGIEYSILVSQYALTDSAYNYLTLMQSNTEQLGSIFDPLPSQLVGNIHCLSDPAEPVVGYISAGALQQQRIFISRSQVPGWLYYFECPRPDRLFPETLDSMIFYFDYNNYVPVDIINNSTIEANVANCIDCRTQGGATQKPAFWP
jgi:hypothetical protein